MVQEPCLRFWTHDENMESLMEHSYFTEPDEEACATSEEEGTRTGNHNPAADNPKNSSRARSKNADVNKPQAKRLADYLKIGKDLHTLHNACVVTMVVFPNKRFITYQSAAFNPVAEKWLESEAGEHFKNSFLIACETEIEKQRPDSMKENFPKRKKTNVSEKPAANSFAHTSNSSGRRKRTWDLESLKTYPTKKARTSVAGEAIDGSSEADVQIIREATEHIEPEVEISEKETEIELSGNTSDDFEIILKKSKKRSIVLRDVPKRPSVSGVQTQRLNSYLRRGKDLEIQRGACIATMIVFPNKMQISYQNVAFNPIADKWFNSEEITCLKKAYLIHCEKEIDDLRPPEIKESIANSGQKARTPRNLGLQGIKTAVKRKQTKPHAKLEDGEDSEAEPSTYNVATPSTSKSRSEALLERPKKSVSKNTGAQSHSLTSFLGKAKRLQTQHDACIITCIIFPNRLKSTQHVFAFHPIAEAWLTSEPGRRFTVSFFKHCEEEFAKQRDPSSQQGTSATSEVADEPIEIEQVIELEDSSLFGFQVLEASATPDGGLFVELPPPPEEVGEELELEANEHAIKKEIDLPEPVESVVEATPAPGVLRAKTARIKHFTVEYDNDTKRKMTKEELAYIIGMLPLVDNQVVPIGKDLMVSNPVGNRLRVSTIETVLKGGLPVTLKIKKK